jgi:hypothetical protein
LYDYELQQEDIIDIFGVENEGELGLWSCDDATKENICRAYREKLCSLKCEIAGCGGFSGFEDGAVGIYNEIKDSGYFDKATQEGAIRVYFLENRFSYDSLCVPYWHELGRQEQDGKTTLYLALYIGHIYSMEDETLMTGASSTVGVITTDLEDGLYYVSDYVNFTGDGEEWLGNIKAYLGDYADDYLAFRETEEYEDMIFNGERLLDSLVEGTFKPEEHITE